MRAPRRSDRATGRLNMHHHGRCPHCNSKRDTLLHKRGGAIVVRCRRCVCRWDLQGRLLFYGSHCPLMGYKKPYAKRVTNLSGSELTGREAGTGSAQTQGQLL